MKAITILVACGVVCLAFAAGVYSDCGIDGITHFEETCKNYTFVCPSSAGCQKVERTQCDIYANEYNYVMVALPLYRGVCQQGKSSQLCTDCKEYCWTYKYDVPPEVPPQDACDPKYKSNWCSDYDLTQSDVCS